MSLFKTGIPSALLVLVSVAACGDDNGGGGPASERCTARFEACGAPAGGAASLCRSASGSQSDCVESSDCATLLGGDPCNLLGDDPDAGVDGTPAVDSAGSCVEPGAECSRNDDCGRWKCLCSDKEYPIFTRHCTVTGYCAVQLHACELICGAEDNEAAETAQYQGC